MWFLENYEDHIFRDIITTLCEIQEIKYLPDNQRSPQTVLRLYKITFIHMLCLKMNLRRNLKNLTRKKIFGSYYYSLIHHCPQQYRVISGRTSNTESEEATLNILKTFTNLASNNHPDDIVSNNLIRTQGKEALTTHKLKTFKEEKIFINLYLPIKNA